MTALPAPVAGLLTACRRATALLIDIDASLERGCPREEREGLQRRVYIVGLELVTALQDLEVRAGLVPFDPLAGRKNRWEATP